IRRSLIINEDDEHLKRYKEIAEHIKDTSEVLEIERIIDEIVSLKKYPIPFIFLGVSSGMGKTQTALTIREKFRPERLVLYFLGSHSDLTQLVYQPFDLITSIFA
ncbi:MAG: hypothetical protein ACK559_25140, partial [bacterium]